MGRIWTRPRTLAAATLTRPNRSHALPLGPWKINGQSSLKKGLLLAIDGSLPFPRMLRGVEPGLTLTSAGAPSAQRTDAGNGYEPASTDNVTNTALTFANQWKSALNRSVLPPWTYITRFKCHTTSPSDQQGIVTMGNDAGNGSYLYSDGHLRCSSTHWSADAYDLGNVTVGRWYTMAVSQYVGVSNYDLDIWLDGVKVHTITAPTTTATVDTHCEIGRTLGGFWGGSLNGVIDYVFLWSRKLPDNDIRKLFHSLGYLIAPFNDRAFVYSAAGPPEPTDPPVGTLMMTGIGR